MSPRKNSDETKLPVYCLGKEQPVQLELLHLLRKLRFSRVANGPATARHDGIGLAMESRRGAKQLRAPHSIWNPGIGKPRRPFAPGKPCRGLCMYIYTNTLPALLPRTDEELGEILFETSFY